MGKRKNGGGGKGYRSTLDYPLANESANYRLPTALPRIPFIDECTADCTVTYLRSIIIK